MELVTIGKVIKPRGVRGEIKVYPYTEGYCMEHYCSLPSLLLGINEQELQEYMLVQARVFQKYFLFIFDGVSSFEGAFALRHNFVFVSSKQRAEVSKDEVLVTDLVGSEVFQKDGKKLGVVIDFFHNGANGVCEVQMLDSDFVENKNTTSKKNSFLFPTTREVLVEVCKAEKKLIIVPLEGML